MCNLWLKMTTWFLSSNDNVVNPTHRISHINCNHINDYNSPWLQSQKTLFWIQQNTWQPHKMSNVTFFYKWKKLYIYNQILSHVSLLT